MNCAFILSPSFSGSTLLSILLAHHPRLTTLGEFLDNRARRYRDGEGDFCSCGEPLDRCPYMTELARDLNEQGMDFSVNFPDLAFRSGNRLADRIMKPYIRPACFEILRRAAIATIPPVRSEMNRLVDRNRKALATILRRSDADVYLDSAKNNARVLYFHRYAPDIPMKVIELKRDGRGVCNSIMNHYSLEMEPAVKWWRIALKSQADTLRHIPESQVLSMFYEDLCADPHAKLAEICRFLDLDMDLMPDEFSAEGLHLTGNNMRLNGLSEIRQDTKWRKALSAEQLEIFERLGGALNRELGYTEA